MTTKTYMVAEAQRHFEKVIREAEHGDDVYIIDDDKQMVKVVPLTEDKERKI
jgi:antitoxin (DNA-binding transcriptional repressor) of toxin-antitoxin stability system